MEQTVKVGNAIVHLGQVVEGRLEVGRKARLEVSPERESCAEPHRDASAQLGPAPRPRRTRRAAGQQVKADEFTFDFAHTGPLSPAEKRRWKDWSTSASPDLPVTLGNCPWLRPGNARRASLLRRQIRRPVGTGRSEIGDGISR